MVFERHENNSKLVLNVSINSFYYFENKLKCKCLYALNTQYMMHFNLNNYKHSRSADNTLYKPLNQFMLKFKPIFSELNTFNNILHYYFFKVINNFTLHITRLPGAHPAAFICVLLNRSSSLTRSRCSRGHTAVTRFHKPR